MLGRRAGCYVWYELHSSAFLQRTYTRINGAWVKEFFFVKLSPRFLFFITVMDATLTDGFIKEEKIIEQKKE